MIHTWLCGSKTRVDSCSTKWQHKVGMKETSVNKFGVLRYKCTSYMHLWSVTHLHTYVHSAYNFISTYKTTHICKAVEIMNTTYWTISGTKKVSMQWQLKREQESISVRIYSFSM